MKKLTLNGITSATASAKPSHPTVDVTDSETNALLVQWAENNPSYNRHKRIHESLGKQLGPKIRALFFERFSGLAAESSTMLVNISGRMVKLITKAAYSKSVLDDAGLIEALGEEFVAKYFKQATVLKLDLDLVPEDKQEAFANGVVKLAADLGVTEAVSAKQCIQPKAGFHDARTSLLSPEKNMKLDAIMPITAYAQL